MRSVGLEINNIVVVLGLLLSAIYSIALGIYIWVRSRGGRVVFWFLTGQLLLAVWTFIHIFEFYAPSLEVRWVVVCLAYIPISYFSVAFYMFTRGYGKAKETSLLKGILIFFVPTVLYISVITNPLHHLFYKEFYMNQEVYGPLCYVLFLVVAVYIVLGVVEFWRNRDDGSIYMKQQLGFISVAALIPISVHVITVLNIVQFGFNIALLAMPFSLTMIAIAVLKYQFLDILPLTLAEVVETIDDGFLVVNNEGDLEDFNALFFEKWFDITKCRNFEQFLEACSHVVNNKAVLNNLSYSMSVKKENYVSGEIAILKSGVNTTIQYTTKAINDIHGVKVATIVTFHDITEIQDLFAQHELKKQELMIAKSKLEEHIGTVQMLSIETERNKLMSEVHDTLGHSMTELLALLEKCDMVLNKEFVDEMDAVEVIDKTLIKARDSLAQIRRSVSKFRKAGVEK